MKSLKIFFLIIIVVSNIFVSCQKSKKVHIISENKFQSILTDIYIADALLGKKGFNDKNLEKNDSLSYYNYIFKKYDITREEFYETYKYYLNNIDKLVKIQQKIVDSLTSKSHKIDSIQKLKYKTNNLWTLKTSWLLPDDGVTNSIPFSIVANKHGQYALMAKIQIFPDDLSKDLKMILRVTYTDSTSAENFVRIFGRSGSGKDYFVNIQTNPHKQIKSISGEVLAHSEATTYMHISVKDIILSYTPVDSTNINTINQK